MTRNILISSLVAGVLCATSGAALAQSARDSITIVGSSTVYPFTTTVAEQFGRAGKFKTPKVESTVSKLASSKGRFSASASLNWTSMPSAAARARPRSSSAGT